MSFLTFSTRNTRSNKNYAAVATFGFIAASGAWAGPPPQMVTNQTVTSVGDVDYGGEVVAITVSQPVVTGCTYATQYVIRDINVIKGGLAVLIAARLSGNSVNLYVTGDCDTTGQPLVASVVMN
jgi:hypothetical protein